MVSDDNADDKETIHVVIWDKDIIGLWIFWVPFLIKKKYVFLSTL